MIVMTKQRAKGPKEAYSAAMAECQPECGIPMKGRMDLAMPSSRGGVGYAYCMIPPPLRELLESSLNAGLS